MPIERTKVDIEVKNVYRNQEGKEGLIVEYVELSQPDNVIPYHLIDSDNTRTANILRQKTKLLKPKVIKDFSSIGTSEKVENTEVKKLLSEKIRIELLSLGIDVSLSIIEDNKEEAFAYLQYLKAERFSDLIANS